MQTQPPPGTLYGIGVGPGDPELVPVKSARILGQVDMVYTAASTKNNYSLAVQIARAFIPETTCVEKLCFPMTHDSGAKQGAWCENAEQIIHSLVQGKNAAFLTLGDPLTYSTYGYLLRYIRSKAPDICIQTIPGITSYQAAAACLNLPLVEGEESLMVVSGAHGGRRLRQMTRKPETVVFLKAYRNVNDIAAAIDESDCYEHQVAVSHCGRPNQRVTEDLNTLCDRQPDYWTLVIAKRKKLNGPYTD